METDNLPEESRNEVDPNQVDAKLITNADQHEGTPAAADPEEEEVSSEDDDETDEDETDEEDDDDDDVVVPQEESSLGFMPGRPGLVANVVRSSPKKVPHPNYEEWKAKKEERRNERRKERRKKRKTEKKAKRAAEEKEEREKLEAEERAKLEAGEKGELGESNGEKDLKTPNLEENTKVSKSFGSFFCICCEADE